MLSIPDAGEPSNDIQAILFQEYLDSLIATIDGTDCVLSGGAVTAQGTPDMTVAVAKAAVLSGGVLYAVAGANATIGTADSTNPRIDLVVINSSGAIAVRAGTAAASPKPAARSTDDVALAAIYVPAGATTITSARITDLSCFRVRGPIVLKKTTTNQTINNSVTITSIFSLTLPSGLFLAGKQLRVRWGGTFLGFASGNRNHTWTISYGGTTLFADVTNSYGSGAGNNVRWAYTAEVILTAVGNASQTLVGVYWNGDQTGNATAPATGTAGDAAVRSAVNPMRGTASVDSDAGNREFKIEITLGSANANIEVQVDFVTAELL